MPTPEPFPAASGPEHDENCWIACPHDEPPVSSAARTLDVGVSVIVTQGHSKGERGVIINSPGRVFNGWTVKLDNGRIFGAGSYELRAAS